MPDKFYTIRAEYCAARVETALAWATFANHTAEESYALAKVDEARAILDKWLATYQECAARGYELRDAYEKALSHSTDLATKLRETSIPDDYPTIAEVR